MSDEKQYPAALVELFDLIMNPTASAGVELVKRLEPVFRDAERYRWLRKATEVDDTILPLGPGAELDADIDEQMRMDDRLGAA